MPVKRIPKPRHDLSGVIEEMPPAGPVIIKGENVKVAAEPPAAEVSVSALPPTVKKPVAKKPAAKKPAAKKAPAKSRV